MAAGFNRRSFRDALGHFPTGVAVVTARTAGEKLVAMTVSSFNAVSLDPPLVLFSVDKGAPSLGALIQSKAFGISILRQEQKDLSRRFSHAQGDKWQGLEPRFGHTGCPLINQCLASFECAHFAAYEGGDHLIIVGRVLQYEMAPGGEPLIFFRGNYHAIAANDYSEGTRA